MVTRHSRCLGGTNDREPHLLWLSLLLDEHKAFAISLFLFQLNPQNNLHSTMIRY